MSALCVADRDCGAGLPDPAPPLPLTEAREAVAQVLKRAHLLGRQGARLQRWQGEPADTRRQQLVAAGVEEDPDKLMEFLRWQVLRATGPLWEIARRPEAGPIPLAVAHAAEGAAGRALGRHGRPQDRPATRISFMRLDRGCQAADELWAAVKARGRPELLSAAVYERLEHPGLDGEEALDRAEERHAAADEARRVALRPVGEEHPAGEAELVDVGGALEALRSLLADLRTGKRLRPYDTGSLRLFAEELLALVEQLPTPAAHHDTERAPERCRALAGTSLR